MDAVLLFFKARVVRLDTNGGFMLSFNFKRFLFISFVK